MEHYAGIDVSLERSSVCVVDAQGKIVKEAKVASGMQPLRQWPGLKADPLHCTAKRLEESHNCFGLPNYRRTGLVGSA